MTNEAMAVADGRFRPESPSHFKEVAKNMAWLLERPVQKCQEDLARIYGYSGLHELQQVMKRPGTPGPFAPRYTYLSSSTEALVEGQEQRIFYVLFGTYKDYWREHHLADDKCFLVFEMGLFQEAAEHRACFEKIRQVLTYEVSFDRWPLIHGWPLGLKSWLVARYTEPFDLVEGWDKVLPPSQYWPNALADIRWQSRMTGLIRLATMFQILAPRIGGRKPDGMGEIDFDQFEDEGGGIVDPSWETRCFVDWLTNKLSQGASFDEQREKRIKAFAERPSRANAAVCEFVKDLKDPVAFRDRWAFESFKAALERYRDQSRALFSSTLSEGAIQSVFLRMDESSVEINHEVGGQLWQFNCTWSEVSGQQKAGRKPKLQPTIHANGSLVVPYDANLVVMSRTDWYYSHDEIMFAKPVAAAVFEKVYMSSIGVAPLDFTYRHNTYSIIEIDELLLSPGVTVGSLKSYFSRLLNAFDECCFPDSYGYWCETLSVRYEDRDGNEERNQNGEYADYVPSPKVVLINVQGCGFTLVEATHANGAHVSTLKRYENKKLTAGGKALAAMVMEAVKGLAIDVVVYDENLF